MGLLAARRSLGSSPQGCVLDLHVSCGKEPSTPSFPFHFLFSCDTLHLCVCEFKLLSQRVGLLCRMLQWLEKLLGGPFSHSSIKMQNKEDLRWFLKSKEKNLGGVTDIVVLIPPGGVSAVPCCCSPAMALLGPDTSALFALSSLFTRLSTGFVKTCSSERCQNQWKSFWQSLKTKESLSYLCVFQQRSNLSHSRKKCFQFISLTAVAPCTFSFPFNPLLLPPLEIFLLMFSPGSVAYLICLHFPLFFSFSWSNLNCKFPRVKKRAMFWQSSFDSVGLIWVRSPWMRAAGGTACSEQVSSQLKKSWL